MKLISLQFGAGRMGDLYGLFIVFGGAALRRWDETIIKEQRSIHFGEVLGKHSEIYGPIEPSDYTLITEDEDRIRKVCEGMGLNVASEGYVTLSGFNPLDNLYFDCEECDDEGCESCDPDWVRNSS